MTQRSLDDITNIALLDRFSADGKLLTFDRDPDVRLETQTIFGGQYRNKVNSVVSTAAWLTGDFQTLLD
jgi:hypothetical protein